MRVVPFWQWKTPLQRTGPFWASPYLVLGMCVLGTLPLSACQDMDHNPLALAVAPETYGAVLFSEELVTVPHLLSEEGLEAEGSAETEAWWESWRVGGDEGARLRALVYSSATRRLFPVLGEAGVSELLARHGEGLAAAEQIRPFLASEAVRSSLRRAASLHAEARASLGNGEAEVALGLVLRSADALWEVTPLQVASELVERAGGALGRIPEPVPYSQQELTRIRRLLNGAKEALGQGDYPLAIRRAYYACQLLGVDPP